MRSMRVPLLLLLVAVLVPSPAEAQLGKLKQALKKASGDTNASEIGEVPPEENGLVAKLYPGAVPAGATHDDVDAYGYALVFYSKDAPEDVRAFYEEHYGELESDPELFGTRANLTLQARPEESSWGVTLMDGVTVLDLLGVRRGEGDDPPDRGVSIFSVEPDDDLLPPQMDSLFSPLAMWVGQGNRSDADLQAAAARFRHLRNVYFLAEGERPAAGAGARHLDACYREVLPHLSGGAGGGGAPDPQKQQQLTQQMIAALQAGRTEEAEKIQRQLEAMGSAMEGQAARVEGQAAEVDTPRWDEWLACLGKMDAAGYRTRIEIAPYPKPAP